MSFESDLYDALKGDATILGLVSTRIYPGVAPSSATLPYMTWTMISGETTHHMGGANSLTQRFIQFDLYDVDLPSVVALRNAVAAELDGKNAAMGSTDVQMSHLVDERFDFIEAVEASESGYFHYSNDYEFWFK